MPSIVEQLAQGIRIRDRNSVERALDLGASPNAWVLLKRHESFGADQAPIIFLAIHYDLPDVVVDFIQRGVDIHRGAAPGLTPRAHAAWNLRWLCLDAFDATPDRNDEDLVLATIANRMDTAIGHEGLEQQLFKRLDNTRPGFKVPPETAFRILTCLLSDNREDAARRLLLHRTMIDFGQRIQETILAHPDWFIIPAGQWFKKSGHLSCVQHQVRILAEFGINFELPRNVQINPEARVWIEDVQHRVASQLCAKALSGQTPASQGENRRGRL